MVLWVPQNNALFDGGLKEGPLLFFPSHEKFGQKNRSKNKKKKGRRMTKENVSVVFCILSHR